MPEPRRVPPLDAVFTPVRVVRPVQDAARQIGEAIRAGYFEPGARLPSERELASQMQISRPTLRDAIRHLVSAGVVVVRSGAGGGMFVESDAVPTALVREWPGPLRPDDVEGVLAARRLIEPRIAQIAAVSASDDERDDMQRAIDYQEAVLTGDLQGMKDDIQLHFTLADSRFHMALARATGNSTLVLVAQLLMHRLEFVREIATADLSRGRLVISMHRNILAAIASGDSQQAEAAMDEHLDLLEQTWEEHSGRKLRRVTPDFLLPVAARENLNA